MAAFFSGKSKIDNDYMAEVTSDIRGAGVETG